jgi:threonyl-tRNA synthetase
MKVTIKGKVKELKTMTAAQALKEFNEKGIAVKINGVLKDLSTVLNNDSTLEPVNFDTEEGKRIFWHSSSHILAQAVKEIYPEAKLGIGPAIENGFYYDFEMPPLKETDLQVIENKMKEIVKKDYKFERIEPDKKQAMEEMKKRGEKYKLEILSELNENISLYKQGDFIDVCTGPHISNTGLVKGLKLTKVSGAYWKGDSKNQQLQRIYGVSFPEVKELEEYLKSIEEAEKRDHRKLGIQLDLFSMHEEGPGFPFFHPNGMILYNKLTDYMRKKNDEYGYKEIRTPIILSSKLWHQSGHWDHYKENMYFTNIDNQEYAVKPMSCPGAILIYKTKARSYRELPLRLSEFGLVHRHELSGVISGLTRVRAFVQDDAHIFAMPEQIESEIKNTIKFIFEVSETLGFKDIKIMLSTMPVDHIGSVEIWSNAENALKKALDESKIKYIINEGDGSFYGPKIDFRVKDALGREWQTSTIQLDFQMPQRFEMEYEGSDGKTHAPVMIHKAIFGSIERLMAILIETTGGDFPTWLAPVQAIILPITDNQNSYALELKEKLKKYRVEVNDKNEKLEAKIRDAQLRKIKYIIIIGKKEVENKNISVREKNQTAATTIEEFEKKLEKENELP